ncbi:hypothetical protein L1987_17164 [Smallanthus sonchifolius]|uniref:Uncharacterized protein n=1 Tax=Smallanthus sonchifolius TaxID=185202 RepID=A0ACB9IY52_9ASTR|nr:hypothetical protein L1987_17164 [Smallanthus sonchifolius]
MDRLMFQPNEVDDHQQLPPIEVILKFPLVLTERIRHAVHESKFYKLECADVGKLVHRLFQMLRSVLWFADSTPLYERPVRRIFIDVAGNLNRALTLVRKCRHRGIIRRFVCILGEADFQKLFSLLDRSIGDMKWLLSIFDAVNGGIILALPPIASNDPILALVWSCIASLHIRSVNLKIEGVRELSALARDSDRIKKIIVEEGGITPLLKLLKHESSPKTQISGAMALFNLANDQNMARSIFNENGVPVLALAFRYSHVSVQTEVAKLIARIAELDSVCQEGFARQNVIETLVTLLSSSIWPRNKKESNPEISQLILELKTNCCGALWMLARGNVATCRRITETRGLLCLAKFIEKEKGELQINCLMTVVEITSAAECNPDIRRSAFKMNSPAGKAVVDQLLRLIDESDNPVIKIPAIRAIGQLARTFSARQTQVISPLVKQLCDRNPDVATESVIALGKFTCPENYLRVEHSKTIVDFEGVQAVMKMLMGSKRTNYHALVLLCYLAVYAGNNEQFQQARISTALEGADKSAAYHLNMFA